MSARSKLPKEQWNALFAASEEEGVHDDVLAERYGVSARQIRWHRRRRALKAGAEPADRRRRPPEGWPADRVHPQSGMTPDAWDELLGRQQAGEAISALAVEYGLSDGTIRRKIEDAGLPPPSRARTTARDAEARVAATRFDYDKADLPATEASLSGQMTRAADEGRTTDFLGLARSLLMSRRVAAREPGADGGEAGFDGRGVDWVRLGLEPELREMQKSPAGEWSSWLFLGGRGAGKTLAGARWLADEAIRLGDGGRLALIGPTLHDVREVMIEGVSGLMSLGRWDDPRWGGRRPVFEMTRRRVVFPNGATAQAFSAEDPESLRGPQFSAAWADEFCAWSRARGGAAETLAMLRMGLRLPGLAAVVGPSGPPDPTRPGVASDSRPPRLMISTTPKPTRALKALRAEAGLVETHAPTTDNADNLSDGFVEGLKALYGGTRRAAQELEGRMVELEGRLWRDGAFEAGGAAPEGLERIVVAIDPTTTAGGCACGIVVAGRLGDRVWVLADRSTEGATPLEWAREAARAAADWKADAIVAEVNQGGDMVRTTLEAAGCTLPVLEVRATRGKAVRAEPVAALYEQGRVVHAGAFRRLEEELLAFGEAEPGWGGAAEVGTDRADALVWAVTDLLIVKTRGREADEVPIIWSVEVNRPPTGITGNGW